MFDLGTLLKLGTSIPKIFSWVFSFLKIEHKWNRSKLRYKVFDGLGLKQPKITTKKFEEAYEQFLTEFQIGRGYNAQQAKFFRDPLIKETVKALIYADAEVEPSTYKSIIRKYVADLNLGSTFYPDLNPEDEFERFYVEFSQQIQQSHGLQEAVQNRLNSETNTLIKALHKVRELIEYSPEELIEKAQEFLGRGEWASALSFYREVLNQDPENTDALLNKAVCLFKTEKLDDCQRVLDKLLRDNSLLPKAYQLRGHVYFNKTMYEFALKEVNKAIEINDLMEDPTKRVEQEKNYQIQGMILQVKGKIAKALESYEKALQVNPNYTNAMNNRALCLKDLKRFEEALSIFNKLIDELQQEDDKYYNNRGTVHEEMGNFELAKSDYEKALSLLTSQQTSDAKIFINLAILLNRQGDATQALHYIDDAIRIDPHEAMSYFNRGVIFAEQKKYTESLEEYGKALALKPNDDQLIHNIAMLYSEQKQYAKAISELEKIALNSRDAIYYYSYGTVLLNYGRFNYHKYFEAIPYLTQAIELESTMENAYLNRCAAYRFTDQYPKALEDTEKLISLNHTAEHLALKGNILYSQEKTEDSIEILFEAIGLSSECANAFAVLSHILYSKKRLIDAHDFVELALSICPGHANFLALKAGILLALGLPDEALTVMFEILEKEPDHVETLENLYKYYHLKNDLETAQQYLDAFNSHVVDFQGRRSSSEVVAEELIDNQSHMVGFLERLFERNPNQPITWDTGLKGKFYRLKDWFEFVSRSQGVRVVVYKG